MTLSTRIALLVAIALTPVLLDDLCDLIVDRGITGKTISATIHDRPAELQVANIQGR